MVEPRDDAALAAAVLRGEPGASEALFERVFDPLYAWCCRRLGGDHHAAEDVVSEALLAGLRGLAGYRGQAALVTWFTAIATRKICDRRRRRSLEIVEDGNGGLADCLRPADGRPEPLDDLVEEEVRSDIRDAVDALPEEHRAVLRWRYFEERSLAEMAGLLRATPKAAERRLARARSALASALRRRGLEA